MDLYVANCSKQRHELVFRLPEEKSYRQQPIEIGTQVKALAPRDGLSQPAIDGIIEHIRAYGALEAGEVKRSNLGAGLCYSVGAPVPAATMRVLMLRNDALYLEQGKRMRAITAAAVTTKAANQTEGQLRLRETDISVVEVEPLGGYPSDRDPMGEGFRVNLEDVFRGGTPGATAQPAGRARRRRAA